MPEKGGILEGKSGGSHEKNAQIEGIFDRRLWFARKKLCELYKIQRGIIQLYVKFC